MKLTMLGTGNALVTDCYNTCYLLEESGDYLLVDGGGGSTILTQLKLAGVEIESIHSVFVTHKHIDHIMGIIWIIRVICQHIAQGSYSGDASIYAHEDLTQLLLDLAQKLLNKGEIKYIGSRVRIIPVRDGEKQTLIGHDFTFFDICSNKAKQYGYMLDLGGGEKLTCCGDEPCGESGRGYARGSKWLLHEAFCLNSQADIFHPYEKCHSTVRDAALLASELDVKNLLLYHTEDKNLTSRKELYTVEAKESFSGNIFVPYDLETIEL